MVIGTALGLHRAGTVSDLSGRHLAPGLDVPASLVRCGRVGCSLRSLVVALAALAWWVRPSSEGLVVVVREVALVVRLSEDERTSWHAAARAAGWGKTAGWVRSVVAAAVSARTGSSAATTATRTSTPTLDPRVLGELSAIGSNVNQLARAVNAAARGGQPLTLETAVVEALRVDVLQLTAAVKAASIGTSTGVSTGASSAGDQR